MVDAADSKSAFRKEVGVQVPSPAPIWSARSKRGGEEHHDQRRPEERAGDIEQPAGENIRGHNERNIIRADAGWCWLPEFRLLR